MKEPMLSEIRTMAESYINGNITFVSEWLKKVPKVTFCLFIQDLEELGQDKPVETAKRLILR